MSDRYPLSWPSGWPRTPRVKRHPARFNRKERQYQAAGGGLSWTRSRQLSVADATARLLVELHRLGVREGDVILSTNIKVRLDGLPYSNQPEPDDVGVAVYFRLQQADRVLACDRWTKTADNIAAIAAHVSAIRAIDRYGVGTLEQAFAGYVGLPAKGTTWRTTLGFPPDAPVTREEIDRAFKARAREAHPERDGGSHDAMASLVGARDEALAAVAADGSGA
jgi:hypothetical protein